MKTSHKKNRPFDFKLIDMVEPHQVLYKREIGLSTYERMKKKNLLWEEIARNLGVSVDFCIMRWGNLRGQFQKELRHCRELCPKEGVIKGSTWPYLERLRFLESTVQFNRPKRVATNKPIKMCASSEIDISMVREDSLSSSDFIGYEEVLPNADEPNCGMDNLIDEILQVENETAYVIEESEEDDQKSHSTHAHNEQQHLEVVAPLMQEPPASTTAANMQKMSALLLGIDGENRARVERRVMAFLCKCQLRNLVHEPIDDLTI